MKVAVVDYGMGNLHSVLKSVQVASHHAHHRADVFLTDKPEDVLSADRVVFPGQGAMPDCMKALHDSGLGEAVLHAFQNKPFLGVCVGAQLLFANSEEGNTAGLGWFAGEVKRFEQPLITAEGERLKVPHMGWNNVYQTQSHPMFQDIANGERFYYVHSYHFAPKNQDIVLAQTEYPDAFACVVGKDNVFATQFHPEKSHQAGLTLLRNFIDWQC